VSYRGIKHVKHYGVVDFRVASKWSRRGGGGARTVGSELFSSPVIQQATQQIVREVQARSAKLTGERGPIESLRVSYDEYLKRASDTRGRGLLYPTSVPAPATARSWNLWTAR